MLPPPVTTTGPGILNLSIAPNTVTTPRTGTISFGSSSVTVTQNAFDPLFPFITSVVDGASFEGSTGDRTWMTITGSNLAPTTRTWGGPDFATGFLPIVLDGTGVKVDGQPAVTFFNSPGQLNVLPNDDVKLGPISVQVTTPHGTSDPFTIYKQSLNPRLFTFGNFNGETYAAAVHLDGTYVGPPGLIPGAPFRGLFPTEQFSVFTTGFGLMTPFEPVSTLNVTPALLTMPVIARIGTFDAPVTFGGYVGAGLYQFNVTTPNLSMGTYPLVLSIAGNSSQSSAEVFIDPSAKQ
jgi:uncharacterized protein (TIGR03437 family)